MAWASTNRVEVLAVQMPGREMRRNEPTLKSCVQVAQQLLSVVEKEVADKDVPYAILAHSVGTWVSFEFLCLVKVQHFLSRFPVFKLSTSVVVNMCSCIHSSTCPLSL